MNSLKKSLVLLSLIGFWIFYSAISGKYAWEAFFLLCMYISLALSYDLLAGYTGYMNLGHASFFGVGAYTTAILLNQGYHFIICLPASIFLAGLLGFVFSLFLIRLHGVHFALAGFAVLCLLQLTVNNFSELTGGSAGMWIQNNNVSGLSSFAMFFPAFVAAFIHYYLRFTRLGMGLYCVRDDEKTASCLGVPVTGMKMTAVVMSSLPAGAAGALYAWHSQYVSPSSVLGMEIALGPIIMAMFGGTGSTGGVLAGVLLLTAAQELLWSHISHFHSALYGGIMILVGIYLPGGMFNVVQSRK